MSTPRLRMIRIACADVGAAAEVLAVVCGSEPAASSNGSSIRVDDVTIELSSLVGDVRPGLWGIEVEVAGGRQLSTMMNGVEVQVQPRSGDGARSTGAADVFVDHVAIAVEDLQQASREWEVLLGVPAELMGVHPVSGGTFTATRFDLDGRMLELVSPVPGTTSAVASRLERVGEGPLALAMPARDLDSKRQQLTDAGVKVLWNDPHWLVHPANPARVMIQLTPRVEHA